MELGFERLSDLALDYRGGRGQRQGTKPDPNDQSLCLSDPRRPYVLFKPHDVVCGSGASWN